MLSHKSCICTDVVQNWYNPYSRSQTLHVPLTRKRVWWTWADSLVLNCSVVHADKAIQILVLIGQCGHMGDSSLSKAWIWLVNMFAWAIHLVQRVIAIKHSCSKLVLWLTQSSNLIGAWKFINRGLRILPKFTRYFSLWEVHGVWARDYTTLSLI